MPEDENSKSPKVPGVQLIQNSVHIDKRGTFVESFKSSDVLKKFETHFQPRQLNTSTSREGTLRGIHWADVPPGQGKIVTVAHGAILDFFIDLRLSSPTFGKWGYLKLESGNGQSLLIPSGIGHGFLALQSQTVVTYLCDQEFNPNTERSINPLDPDLGIPFRSLAEAEGVQDLIISEKDANAMSLYEARSLGLLPT